jgi:hypothetical protein
MPFYDDTDGFAGGPNFRFGNATDKQGGVVIQFYHVPTAKKALQYEWDNGSQATFKAFLTQFKDNFKVNWNGKETFGRMDAIQTYKNTQRQISIEFEVPSYSLSEATINFINLQKLIMMQYPVYEVVETSKVVAPSTPPAGSGPPQPVPTAAAPTTVTAATGTDRDLENAAAKSEQEQATVPTYNKNVGRFMSSPPLIYVKFLNWISNDISRPARNVLDVRDALVATISEVSFSPDLDQGYHFSEGKLIPKLFTINLNLTIIHTQELGWVNKVEGSNESLDTHVFGEPRSLNTNTEGFQQYGIYPYQTDTFSYRKVKKEEDGG